MDLSAFKSPARVAALLTAVSSLSAGLVPAVANLDTRSTAGMIGGIVGMLGAYSAWAKGRRQHEAFQAGGVQVPWPPDPEPADPSLDPALVLVPEPTLPDLQLTDEHEQVLANGGALLVTGHPEARVAVATSVPAPAPVSRPVRKRPSRAKPHPEPEQQG